MTRSGSQVRVTVYVHEGIWCHLSIFFPFILTVSPVSVLGMVTLITTVRKLAQAINDAGGGEGGRWWLKRKDGNACVIGLYDSKAGEVVFSRELWGVQSPTMHLQKLGDWSDVDYGVATDVVIYCQKKKITFGRV